MAFYDDIPLSEWLRRGVAIGRRDGARDAPVLWGTQFEGELYQTSRIRLSQGTLDQVYEAYRSAYSQARMEALPAKLITAVSALREDVARQHAELMALLSDLSDLGERLGGSASRTDCDSVSATTLPREN